MEPLSALSIAAAAVQFFDFAQRILRGYTEICQAGEMLDLRALEKTSKDLADLHGAFARRETLKLGQITGEAITEHEVALNVLMSECNASAIELITILEKLKVKPGRTKWSNFRQALLSVWEEDRMKALEERISTYQKQLVTRLLAYLNAKTDLYAKSSQKQLEKLDANDAEIMKVMGFTQTKLLSETRKNHQEVVSALFTLTNGELRTMSASPGRSADTEHNSALGTLDLRTQEIWTFQNGRTVEQTEAHPIHQAVLDCLQFRHIRDRFDSAKNRHRHTLEWIYRDPIEAEKPWSNFRKWLSSQDEQIFWINGKPGSGKTTLMKFLCQDNRTMDGLRLWAGQGQLAIASFFFWNLGPFEIQKSQTGLLRSLLYDVLMQAPSLIPVVMPELCLDILKTSEERKPDMNGLAADRLGMQTSRVGDPMLPELLRWFRNLLQQSSANLRLCFVIDGLDEYTGDYKELIYLILEEVKLSPWIKFIISSRPIIPCTESFSSFPSLRLQDLNFDDIREYAADMLRPKLGLLSEDSEPRESSLLDQLTDKSSGVFLWVVLVVRSIIEGLENGDRMSELQGRLKHLPSDLAELYHQMFSKIRIEYRQ